MKLTTIMMVFAVSMPAVAASGVALAAGLAGHYGWGLVWIAVAAMCANVSITTAPEKTKAKTDAS